MSITSISAVGGGYNFYTSPYAGSATGTQSVTQLASGAQVTTIRGATGAVVSVTTAIAAAYNAPQTASSTVDVTA